MLTKMKVKNIFQRIFISNILFIIPVASSQRQKCATQNGQIVSFGPHNSVIAKYDFLYMTVQGLGYVIEGKTKKQTQLIITRLDSKIDLIFSLIFHISRKHIMTKYF